MPSAAAPDDRSEGDGDGSYAAADRRVAAGNEHLGAGAVRAHRDRSVAVRYAEGGVAPIAGAGGMADRVFDPVADRPGPAEERDAGTSRHAAGAHVDGAQGSMC